MTFPGLLIDFLTPLKKNPTPPWDPSGVGKFFLAQNESRIYPNMCAKFGCSPTVVSKKGGGYRQRDRQRKLQLYIVDYSCFKLNRIF